MRKPFAIIVAILLLTGCNDKADMFHLEVNQTLRVYPNPASETAWASVSNSSNHSYTLKVFNPKGKVILDQSVAPGDENFAIPLQKQPEGTYQVILDTGSSVITFKLLKV